MIDTPPPNRILRAAAFALLALGAGALACETSPPEPDASADASAQQAPGDPPESTRGPEFIPYDVAPELQNPEEVQARLQEVYPESLEQDGVSGTVILWIFVNEEGSVEETRVKKADREAFGTAARTVVEAMEFSPALQGEEPTGVWVQQRIRFRPEETDPSERTSSSANPPESYRQILDRMAAGTQEATITVDGDTVTAPRVLEDLQPEEIERIEVVKLNRPRLDIIRITTERG